MYQRDPSPAPGRKGSSGKLEGGGGGGGGGSSNRLREVKEKDKLERRLMEVCLSQLVCLNAVNVFS